ncbi:hypothetical protein AVEN_170574-1 [Araneus ventricosus]|uniref:SWIM-type domain-containing protein n=1 Tax=Araneus ventricosus TaxID=182803 RepID=A0A4Y2SLD0_ARAVE|nr:hypothetical protein AVEN_170574-1 [Araneus ventricosus]
MPLGRDYNWIPLPTDFLEDIDIWFRKYPSRKEYLIIPSQSAKESYGDNGIEYVEVKRDGDLCTVKGRITPYSAVLVCNESEDVILSVKCAASQGGCKHAVAFLAWVHRRSEEPPVISIKCY